MKHIKRLGFLTLLLVMGSVASHSGAVGIVKERMDAMDELGDYSKQVADMFKGKTEFKHQTVLDAADVFVMHAAAMSDLFPDTDASRTGSETAALPLIWQEKETFDRMVNEFETLSIALKATVESTEDQSTLKKAFFTTTKSCSACHKKYRRPKR